MAKAYEVYLSNEIVVSDELAAELSREEAHRPPGMAYAAAVLGLGLD